MKFKKLELWNVTSLRGHHIVDFERLTAGDDLFAITGPTGSGKSSLLSAISFSLFNKHYKSIRPQDIISYGESESKIILSFSINAFTYEAHWSLRIRTKKGELLKNIPTATHEFYQNGEIIHKSVEEIIGLTFDQFNRSVILNQGEFSRFLLSPFTDRRKILEEMYGGEDLTLINTILKNKKREIEESIGKKRHTLDNALPFSDEEAKQKDDFLLSLKQKYKDSQELTSHLKRSKDSISHILKLIKDKIESGNKELEFKAQHEVVLKEKNILKETLSKAKAALLELSQSKKIMAPYFESYRQEEIKLKNTLEKIEDIELRQKSVTQKFELSKKQKEQLYQSLAEKKQKITGDLDLQKISEEISLYKREREICNEMTLLLQKIENNRSESSSKQIDLKKLEDKGKVIASEISSLELSKKDLEITDQDLLERIQKNYEKLTVLESDWLKHLRKIQEDEKQIVETKASIQQIEIELKESEANYKNVSAKLKLTQENIELKRRLIHLNHFIEEARHSNECPVCHNKDNLDHLQVIHIEDEAIESIEELSLEKEQGQNQFNLVNFKAEGQKAELLRLVEKIDEEKKKIISELQYFSIIYNSLSSHADIQKQIDHHRVKLNELRDNAQKLQVIKNDLKRNNELREQLRKDYIEVKNSITSKDREYEELKASYQSKESILTHKNIESLPKLRQDLAQKEEKLTDILNIIREVTHLEEGLNNINKHLADGENDLFDLKKTHEQATKEREAIKIILEDLSRQIKKLAPEIKDFSEFLRELDLKIQKSEEDLEQKNKEAEARELEFNTLETKIEGQKDKIKSIDLLLLTEESVLKKALEEILKKNLNSNFIQETTKFVKSSPILKHNEKNEVILEGLTYYFDYHFIPFFDTTTDSEKHINEDVIKLKSELDLFKQKKEQAEIWKNEIKDGLTLLERYKNLSDAIGGNEFRDFALTVIENELLKLTNHELEILCDGRYRLESKDASTGQEFMVNDNFQAGAKRKVTTLSGGETFLVSLAMALGLSEMTRGNTEIESFFIDEGFGSLDHDSINEVIDVLMNVRNRGKQIGVISHVKALTDRLPISLRLHKNQLGDGTLSIETSY